MALKGFAGQILYVDLTKGIIEKRPLLEEDVSRYLGGAGINAKLALEHIPPGCDPLGPENALIYGVGLLIGTAVPGAARTVVTAKSPFNGYYGTSAAGHFGTMLKFAGYDHVVITGRSAHPVYLNIVDDKVTIEDARALWGKDVYEFTDHVWQRDPEAWVSCIGPAGENLVSYAVIVQNKFSTYGTGGLGAVMGSKNLKGLVARGTREVELADPNHFTKVARLLHEGVLEGPYVPMWREYGTLIQHQQKFAGDNATHRSHGPNFRVEDWTESYKEDLWEYCNTCPSCPVGCKARLKIKQGTGAGAEFTISCPAGSLTRPFPDLLELPQDRPDQIARCAELANRLGISTISGLTDALEWAIHAYEQGYITKEQTGGIELARGKPEVVERLMLDIAYRRGFGDLLADTAERAQAWLGKEPDDYTIRKGTRVGKRFPGQRWGDRKWSVLFFGNIVDPRASGPANAYSSVTYMPGRSADALQRYAERIGVTESERRAMLNGETDGYDIPRMTRAVELYNLVLYSVGSCQRPFISKVLDIDTLADLFKSATGLKISAADLVAGAQRVITMQRLFNVRQGLTKDMDLYAPGYLSADDQQELSDMLGQYYELHGWDANTGIPKTEAHAQAGVR